MREFLLGVLGAALLYFAAWYRMAPEDATAAGVVASQQPARGRGADVRSNPRSSAAEGARPDEQRSSAGFQASLEPPPAEAVRPSEAVTPSDAVMPSHVVTPSHVEATTLAHAGLPAALPKAIEQMSELQNVAADPKELEARLRKADISESELAELRAFAEKFVILPPDRVERHISGSAGRFESSGVKPP
jgi:hypothetical protein